MSYRLEKFASTLQQALGGILSRESLNPDFKRASVVRVQLSRDLKKATVFIACPPEQAGRILEQLDRSRGFIKKQLASKMILRHMPELDFVRDTALELENRLDLLIPQGDGGLTARQACNPEGDHEETDR
jgi:ribosome-binding factor A